jgi:hypothetical protein
MQFRVQANKLQFIRSVYNSEKRRCDQKLVGSMPAHQDEFPSDDTVKNLSADERKELADYLQARAAKKLSDNRITKIQIAGYSLSGLADAIQSVDAITESQAKEIWEGLAKVSKALKKAGHTKPAKPTAPAVQAAPSGQGDLLAVLPS